MLKQKFAGVPWTMPQTFGGVIITFALYVFVALFSNLFFHIPTTSPSLAGDVALSGRALLYSILAEGVFLAVPLYFAYRASRQVPFNSDRPSIGNILGLRRFRVRSAATLIVAGFVVIVLVNNFYQWIIATFHLSIEVNSELILHQGKIVPVTTYVMLAAAVFWAPFCEELFFRSFTFMGLKNEMSVLWAVLLSAFIFAAFHLDPGSFSVLFVIGAALALLRWKTDSVWPGMILHFMNNGLSALLVILSLRGII